MILQTTRRTLRKVGKVGKEVKNDVDIKMVLVFTIAETNYLVLDLFHDLLSPLSRL